MECAPRSHHQKKMLVTDKGAPHAYYKNRSPACCPQPSSSAGRKRPWASHQNVL